MCAAEGGAASQAVATASARALSEGGEPALAVARAYAYAIAVFSCPGVKPVIYSAQSRVHLTVLSRVAFYEPLTKDAGCKGT